jgi:hypothetical protein
MQCVLWMFSMNEAAAVLTAKGAFDCGSCRVQDAAHTVVGLPSKVSYVSTAQVAVRK